MPYKDLEVRKKFMADYYQKHKKEFLEYNRTNKARRYAWREEWIKKNPDKAHMFIKQRTANSKYPGILRVRTIQMVYEDNVKKHGTLTCYLCLKPVKFGKDTLDHKIPATRGGTNDYENLAIAHLSCNGSKRSKTPEEYYEYLEKKSYK